MRATALFLLAALLMAHRAYAKSEWRAERRSQTLQRGSLNDGYIYGSTWFPHVCPIDRSFFLYSLQVK